ncbi:CRE-SRR-5 protein, partial [Aphelenchoides avenae]
LFSKNWAINLALALLSIHGFASLLFFTSLNSRNFFNEFAQRLALVLKNKTCSSPQVRFTKAHVLMALFVAFYVYSCVFYGVENFFDYEEVTSKVNHTAQFRNSMFGNQSLWIADVFIQVWTAFCSATVLVLYFLINNAMVGEYANFNRELKEASKNGSLQDAELLTKYGARLLEFLDLVKYANDALGGVATFTWLVGLVVLAVTGATMRGFREEMGPLEMTVVLNFMILGLLYLLIDLKCPATLFGEVQETKNILLIDRSIWNQREGELLNTANNIISRIQAVDYAAHIFARFKLTNAFFYGTMLVIPFVVEFINALKKHVD